MRDKIYQIIFKTDTPASKTFDIWLLIAIFCSVVVVLLDSVGTIHEAYSKQFLAIEWGFTILFSVEYLLRLYSVRNRLKYTCSFFGIIDLLAILPTYLMLFIDGAEVLSVVRVLRLIRVFRVFKLVRYLDEMSLLIIALRSSRRKIVVFLGTVITTVIVIGAMMYVIEGGKNGFTDIPTGIYWAIVTLTTVGYGDIHPVTPFGKFVAAVIMILGYGVIAVPTGIVSVELQEATRSKKARRKCHECGLTNHEMDALYCKRCGTKMDN